MIGPFCPHPCRKTRRSRLHRRKLPRHTRPISAQTLPQAQPSKTNLIPGLERALEGRVAGDKKTVVVRVRLGSLVLGNLAKG